MPVRHGRSAARRRIATVAARTDGRLEFALQPWRAWEQVSRAPLPVERRYAMHRALADIVFYLLNDANVPQGQRVSIAALAQARSAPCADVVRAMAELAQMGLARWHQAPQLLDARVPYGTQVGWQGGQLHVQPPGGTPG